MAAGVMGAGGVGVVSGGVLVALDAVFVVLVALAAAFVALVAAFVAFFVVLVAALVVALVGVGASTSGSAGATLARLVAAGCLVVAVRLDARVAAVVGDCSSVGFAACPWDGQSAASATRRASAHLSFLLQAPWFDHGSACASWLCVEVRIGSR